MLDDLPQSLGPTPATQLFRLLVTLGNHVRSRMDQRLAPSGLTTQQAAALTIVDHADPPATLGAIAVKMGTSHQNVRQIVAVLERKGLVTVAVDPDDRRARRVVATGAVAELFGPRDQDDQDALAGWFGVLTAEEQAATAACLGRVLRHLQSLDPQA